MSHHDVGKKHIEWEEIQALISVHVSNEVKMLRMTIGFFFVLTIVFIVINTVSLVAMNEKINLNAKHNGMTYANLESYKKANK